MDIYNYLGSILARPRFFFRYGLIERPSLAEIGPTLWMILTGAGLYLSYTPFNAILFDRIRAAIARAGNAGFLTYVDDASGHCGSVALLLYRSFANQQAH